MRKVTKFGGSLDAYRNQGKTVKEGESRLRMGFTPGGRQYSARVSGKKSSITVAGSHDVTYNKTRDESGVKKTRTDYPRSFDTPIKKGPTKPLRKK